MSMVHVYACGPSIHTRKVNKSEKKISDRTDIGTLDSHLYSSAYHNSVEHCSNEYCW